MAYAKPAVMALGSVMELTNGSIMGFSLEISCSGYSHWYTFFCP